MLLEHQPGTYIPGQEAPSDIFDCCESLHHNFNQAQLFSPDHEKLNGHPKEASASPTARPSCYLHPHNPSHGFNTPYYLLLLHGPRHASSQECLVSANVLMSGFPPVFFIDEQGYVLADRLTGFLGRLRVANAFHTI